MKKSEKKELIKQISRLCEKQYRKGVQHGTEIHFGSPSQKKVSFKFRQHGIKTNYNCHNRLFERGFGSRMIKKHYIDLLSAECNMSNMSELRNLLDQF